MSPNLVEITALRKSYPVGNLFGRRTVEVLHGVSLQVRAGSTFGLLGPNGAGKTTTIKTLAGLIYPSSGTVLINGVAPWKSIGRRDLGFLPENPSFYDTLTGREILIVLGRLLGAGNHALRATELLEQVGLAHAADLQVRKYSKGMTQRLGIAQAILGNPPLVVLDEPMSGLDPMGRHDVKDLIRALRGRGTTIVFSTHITADVEEICDDLAIIVGGSTVRSGTVQDVVSADVSEYEVVATEVPLGFANRDPTPGAAASTFTVRTESAARELMSALWGTGAHVISLTRKRARLEDVLVTEAAKNSRTRLEHHG